MSQNRPKSGISHTKWHVRYAGGPDFTDFQLLPREVALIRNAKVAGSTPVSGTNEIKGPQLCGPFFVSGGRSGR